VDLVICADVIEHVKNPDELIHFIIKMDPEHIVISTPDRDLLHEKLGRSQTGPPGNTHHIREWSFDEFENYISRNFNIIRHEKIRKEYGQVIYCKLKEK
jgi:2-polyprenyl-3-methyl-5-hydroxy-6-metoxy-1,4-benzoquinol methylase